MMKYPCANLPPRRRDLTIATAVLCAALGGCGDEGLSPIERFERLPALEDLVTIELGEYVIPIPVEPTSDSPIAATQVQIEFRLYAAVLPENEGTLRSNYERLEGRFRDTVIETCRNTSIEDLLDPTMTTLKTHLADSLKPYIGSAHLERIHIANPQVKRL
ncbi:hypothetical protein NG895_08800 [Aeoliella sp. ICT_H6.2]|uniref:Uncharacterized protein n=2 Tax=Aeoliella straminimaris TaxID=2954799 RepID=A0A9X2JFH1_9BACT|nr:hypothetical protein [Aeoliella straminimaris]